MKKWLLLICACALLMLCVASCSCDTEEEENSSTVTVKFETYIDTAVEEQRLSPGSLALRPGVILKRPGYNFMGWYNGDKKWDFDKNTVDKDITLTARWERYLSFQAISEIESPSVKALFTEEQQDSLIVTGLDLLNTTEVVIPESYNGKRVIAILRFAFADRKNLKSVVIPESIVSIGEDAFYGCTALEEINCVAKEKPKGWLEDFDVKARNLKTGEITRHNVVFGYDK